MASSKFKVKTYIFEGQHIRHYPGATRHHESDVQYLEAKQYIPLDNPNPKDGDVTIIGTHATSFPKELYEPLWEDLLLLSEENGFRIRSIWMADSSHQGASGVINEHTQGDDPSNSDYARDILHMTNLFRKQMPQPTVGIGHSMGATGLIELSCMHPRLMSSLILFDPIIGMEMVHMGALLVYMSSVKGDLFPSREVADKIFKKAFKKWDPRTFERWMEYGLRDTPTLLYPHPGKIALRTTKANEAFSYARPRFGELAADGSMPESSKIKYPDAIPEARPMYRPEIMEAYEALPRVRPDVLFVFPEKSGLSREFMDHNVARTGTAVGGSGGEKQCRVAQATVKGAGHLCTFEDPTESARVAAEWLGKDLQAWRERVEYEKSNRDDKSIDRIKLSDEWMRRAKQFYNDVQKAKPTKSETKL